MLELLPHYDTLVFLLQYEFLERKSVERKRKRGESEAADSTKFNISARISLKEVYHFIGLLEPRHMLKLDEGGIGHIRNFSIKSNINRRLMCFLMYKIEPTSMTLDLGDGQKVLKINAAAMQKLFGLPRGNLSPPRPSDNMHDKALMDLKAELGFSRQKQVETKDLRKLLAQLVKDPKNDDLALKIIGIILYNKFICPGLNIRIGREAPMVENFDITKLKLYDLCQLLIDELRKAVIAWQKSDSVWAGIPGCAVAPLLMYLDCIDDRKLNPKDKRMPRALYMNESNMVALSELDIVTRGNNRPDSWIFGKMPVSLLF